VPSAAVDIGGGWGRLGMAWTAAGCKSVTIMDSIEQPYILQNLYLRSVPNVQFNELLEINQEFSLQQLNGLNHIPFWNISLIPSRSIQVVTAVQLLREVDEAMVLFLVTQLQRILKPGGIFYIRDNDPSYKTASMHNLDIHKLLDENGFKLVMQTNLIQGKDIHGLPRIYQLHP
jgi:SAM-dependent methyltransferase